ncbi:10842_t:CDS:2 [Funneliformis geosporum]|uniref:10842_t:CDS:1 n=1 Tax=Funneliformis geosporum TaxID=1117311 RepID=A0A9W4WVN4_9GLOM|nr:10842_t:CDS:2 [Funneliformis geosporum]
MKYSVCGIFHHSQTTLVTREEICSCPNYELANRFREFGSTYKLKLNLYKVDGKLLDVGSVVEDEELKMVVTPDVRIVEDIKTDTKELWD